MTIVRKKEPGQINNRGGIVKPTADPTELISVPELHERVKIEKAHDPKVMASVESPTGRDRFQRKFGKVELK